MNFLNENVWISIKISLKFVPKGQINNIPSLDQIMAWRRPGDKPLSEPMMVSLLTHMCVTRPQWGSGTLYWWVLRYCFRAYGTKVLRSSYGVAQCLQPTGNNGIITNSCSDLRWSTSTLQVKYIDMVAHPMLYYYTMKTHWFLYCKFTKALIYICYNGTHMF